MVSDDGRTNANVDNFMISYFLWCPCASRFLSHCSLAMRLRISLCQLSLVRVYELCESVIAFFSSLFCFSLAENCVLQNKLRNKNEFSSKRLLHCGFLPYFLRETMCESKTMWSNNLPKSTHLNPSALQCRNEIWFFEVVRTTKPIATDLRAATLTTD